MASDASPRDASSQRTLRGFVKTWFSKSWIASGLLLSGCFTNPIKNSPISFPGTAFSSKTISFVLSGCCIAPYKLEALCSHNMLLAWGMKCTGVLQSQKRTWWTKSKWRVMNAENNWKMNRRTPMKSDFDFQTSSSSRGCRNKCSK